MGIQTARGLILGALLAVAAMGCGGGRPAGEALADLSDPATEVRMKAAREIEGDARRNRGLPANVTDALIAQYAKESDAKTKGAIITALGYTGDPRVKPLLEDYVKTDDPNQQRWGSRAYKKYATATGMFPEGHKFQPETWPFGTPGYPSPTFK